MQSEFANEYFWMPKEKKIAVKWFYFHVVLDFKSFGCFEDCRQLVVIEEVKQR